MSYWRSDYPSYGPDDDLPAGRAYDDIRRTRDNRRKQNAPAPAPAPRSLTQRDIADYDRAAELREVQQTARAIRQQEIRVQRIEAFMQRDHAGYMNSVWHDEYSRLTGSLAEAKIRSR